MLRSLVLSAALIAAPMIATAADWTLDKSHAVIAFSVDHLGFSTTRGIFEKYDATIDFQPDNVEASSVEVVIDAASINTFWAARDEHLRNADFFNVEKFPTITFKSTKIEKTGDDTAKIMGDMTMLGMTKPVTFDAKLTQMGPHPFNPKAMVAGMQVTGTIDRTEFGMGTFAPAVGAVIPFTFDLELNAPAS